MTPRPPPIQEGLDQLSNDFSYHLLWGAKKLRRGELLLAKQVCDCYLTRAALGRRSGARGGTADIRSLRSSRHRPCSLRAKGELYGALEDDVAQGFGLAEPVDRGEILGRLDALLANDLA
jgi:hypothetical protein